MNVSERGKGNECVQKKDLKKPPDVDSKRKADILALKPCHTPHMMPKQPVIILPKSQLPYSDEESYLRWLSATACKRLSFDELRPFQIHLSAHIHYHERDVAAFLPTSCGKSSLIHIPASLDLELDKISVSLVSVPTKALASDHVCPSQESPFHVPKLDHREQPLMPIEQFAIFGAR